MYTAVYATLNAPPLGDNTKAVECLTTSPSVASSPLPTPSPWAQWLALLLVNDWLLKPVWQSDWTTGKFSDFAWMVFAPPVLLFALSLLARANPRAECGAWLTAYLGLPLLYAAYNASAPLHVWIMQGFALLSGGGPGSPLDPSDSLVILPAMAVALWVWRTTVHSAESLRTRLHLYSVAVAALSTVATSYAYPDLTAWHIGLDTNDVVVRGRGLPSYDGGLTWGYQPDRGDLVGSITYGSLTVETPRGTYSVEDNVIYRTSGSGERDAVHSLRYLTEERNFWAQAASTKVIRQRSASFVSYQRSMLARQPYGMVYHHGSGNVIVSLGILGVVVGDADETWTPVAVGRYEPFDRSFLGRARWLFTPDYWFAAIAVPLAFIAGTFALKARQTGAPQDPGRRQPSIWRGLAVLAAFILALPALWLVSSVGPAWIQPVINVLSSVLTRFLWIALILLFLSWPFLLFAYALDHARRAKVRRFVALSFAALGVLITTTLLEPYQFGFEWVDVFEPFFWLAGAVFAMLAFLMYRPTRAQFPSVALAFLAMNLIMPLPFFLWLLGGINLAIATASSAALLALTAHATYRHLERNNLLQVTEAVEDPPLTPVD